MHEQWSKLPPETERDLIARTTEALTEAIGRRPRGWRAPSGLTTTETVPLLHAAGYAYDSSFGDDDIPYWLNVGGGRAEEIMEIPWSWSLDDAAFYAYPGTIRRPDEVADLWIGEFDAAYAMTGCFVLVCHPRYSGRPARLLALERLIEHIERQDGIWFARCEEIAAHAATDAATPHYPAPAVLGDNG
jgi:peptidoglycan/xylan/chitin deacetylase (PgdA/CDA1 family)